MYFSYTFKILFSPPLTLFKIQSTNVPVLRNVRYYCWVFAIFFLQLAVIFSSFKPLDYRPSPPKAIQSSDKEALWGGVAGFPGDCLSWPLLNTRWDPLKMSSGHALFSPHHPACYWQWSSPNENLVQTLYGLSTALRIKSKFPTTAHTTSHFTTSSAVSLVCCIGLFTSCAAVA